MKLLGSVVLQTSRTFDPRSVLGRVQFGPYVTFVFNIVRSPPFRISTVLPASSSEPLGFPTMEMYWVVFLPCLVLAVNASIGVVYCRVY